jgi:hypothetical protein
MKCTFALRCAGEVEVGGTAADIIKPWTKWRPEQISQLETSVPLPPLAGTFRTQFTGLYMVLRTHSTVSCVGPTELSRPIRHRLELRLPGIFPIFVSSISDLDSSFFFKSWYDWMQPCAQHDLGISCTVCESHNGDLQRQWMDKRPFITSLWRVLCVKEPNPPDVNVEVLADSIGSVVFRCFLSELWRWVTVIVTKCIKVVESKLNPNLIIECSLKSYIWIHMNRKYLSEFFSQLIYCVELRLIDFRQEILSPC